jgi:phage recombination protein Bet
MSNVVALQVNERLNFSTEAIAAAKNIIAPGAPDHIIQLVLARCQTLGVDPMARMIYAVNRKRGGATAGIRCFDCGKPLRKSSNDPEYYCWRKREGCGAVFPEADPRVVEALAKAPDESEEGGTDNWTLQASIDFFRSTAESSTGYAGQVGPHWCGEDGVWREVWLKKWGYPAAARVGVMRAGFAQPLFTVAMFDEFAAIKGGKPDQMWAKMPALMIAKCAEALAIRRGFPSKLSGIYTDDEMQQADNSEPVNVTPLAAPALAPPAAMVLAGSSLPTGAADHKGSAPAAESETKRPEPDPPAAPKNRKELIAAIVRVLELRTPGKGSLNAENMLAIQADLQATFKLPTGKALRDYSDSELAAYLALKAGSPPVAIAQEPKTETAPSEPNPGRVALSPPIQKQLRDLIEEKQLDEETVQNLAAWASAEHPIGVTYTWELLTVDEALRFREEVLKPV